jgi:hypothetical protein
MLGGDQVYGVSAAVSICEDTFIDCLTSFLQRVLFGELHRWELLIAGMKGLGPFRMLDQCVIALPIAVR